MYILLVALLLTGLFLSIIIVGRKYKQVCSFREVVIITWIFFFLWVYIITELLSLFNGVSLPAIAAVYAVSVGVLLAFIIREKKNLSVLFEQAPYLKAVIKSYSWLLGGIVFVLIVTGFIAAYAAPNNWDSMTYHLGRVMHWIQNGNVAHYPTHISRQLFNPPLAEYAMAHLYLLGHGDRWVNMLQYVSFIQCIVVVSLVVKALGYDFKTQLYASLVATTIPMAILQATNTKNELTVAFFVVAVVYFLLCYFKSAHKRYIVFCGLTMGLSLATKSTSYIYLFPVFVAFFFPFPLKYAFSKIKAGLVAGAIALLLVLPLYLRNYTTYGHLLGATENERGYYKNEECNIKTTISNISRNAFIHLANDYLFDNEKIFREKAEWFKYHLYKLHERLGIAINDPKTTWGGITIEYNISRDEDYAGNFLHFILIVTAVFFLAFQNTSYSSNRGLCRYILMIAGGCLFFCLYLKWQPWHSRLHLPLFVLSVPLAAIFINSANKYLAKGILVILFCGSVSYLFENSMKGLLFREPKIYNLTRDELMFVKKGTMPMADCYELSGYISAHKIKAIGLILNGDGWDYPIWHIIKRQNPEVKIFHVNVPETSTPATILQKEEEVIPELIFSTESNHAEDLYCGNVLFKNVKKQHTGDLYVRSNP